MESISSPAGDVVLLEDEPAGGPTFLDRLFDRGLLVRTGVDGLYGRSGGFESVVDALDRMITRLGAAEGAEVLRFPPAMSRPAFERSGYLKGFPNLAGTVHSFCGDARGHAEILACLEAGTDWTGQQEATDVVLTPAACYPVYPVAAARARCRPRAACSTCNPTASGASRRWSRPGCSSSGCASTCAWAAPSRFWPSAKPGSSAARP